MTAAIIWFISVVVVGFLINLAAAYLKPHLDKWWANYSTSRRLQNEKQADEFEQQVQQLLNSDSNVVNLKLDILTNGASFTN